MIYFTAGMLIIVVDQVSKAFIRKWLPVGESLRVIGDFFKITHVENTGAAFNSLAGNRFILIMVPLILMAGCGFYILRHRNERRIVYVSMTMIIAGGMGNLIDRVFFGSVTDMFDFSVFPPVFNVADICVTSGCVLLIFGILWENGRKRSNER